MTKTVLVLFLTIVFLRPTESSAQQTAPAINTIASSLSKVVIDFGNNFQNIAGEQLNDNVQSQDYISQVCLPGAEQCIVTRYSAKGKPVYSWQATMPAVEEFGQAKKQYHDLFNQLQNLLIVSGDRSFHLKGTYQAPDESLKFYSTVLTPDSKDASVSKLRVEIVLEADMLEWNTRVLVYNKEREDDERGDIYEN